MKALDLNKAKKQTFQVTMMDEAQTTFHLVTPNVTLVQDLKGVGEELKGALDNDESAMTACYDIAAKLFSCNRTHTVVTADELCDKYNMELEDLILFFNAYMEFISELTQQKN